ncbi:hypothetical protein V5O48_007356 [Marasmius crinis-equi]|uniref:GATA-type domain-containing protein n=1 Tax=Marasmius crinis-equi TaxID=585013 RepID=A0ABR3FGW9_9AGAR
MCDSCREKHRRYATTKRAKRKLEKAAIQGHTVVPIEQIPGSALWLTRKTGEDSGVATSTKRRSSSATPVAGRAQKSISTFSTTSEKGLTDAFLPTEESAGTSRSTPTPTPSASNALSSLQTASPTSALPGTSWDISSIDPRMFEAQPSSSELAGALTFLPRVHPSGDAIVEAQTTQSQTNEETVEFSAPTEFEDATPAPESSSSPHSRRYCSIKGCKAVLPGNSSYKMCTPCRDRYRTYGVTKRAKWKAERIAFDHELEKLRRVEDERREREGLRPLSESPEELRAWELAIIDEKVTLPPTLANVLSTAASNAAVSSSPYALSLTQILEPLDKLSPAQALQLAQLMQAKLESKTSSLTGTAQSDALEDTPPTISDSALADALSSVLQGGDPASSTSNVDGIQPSTSLPDGLPSSLVLPQRMCTVSHCHTILPGHYLYKRCDRHRYQNRKHGKLKRVREKAEKGKGPDGSGAGEDDEPIDADAILKDDSEPFDSEAVEKKKIETKARERAKLLILSRKPPGVRRTRTRKPKDNAGSTSKEELEDPDGEADSDEGEDESTGTSYSPYESNPVMEITEPRASGSNHAANEKRKGFACTASGCSNLINPHLRWKMCENCRELRKELRLSKKSESEKPAEDSGLTVFPLAETPEDSTGIVAHSLESPSSQEAAGSDTHQPSVEHDPQYMRDQGIGALSHALAFKAFTPKDVRSAQDDPNLLFGVLHVEGTEIQPAMEGRDEFIATGFDESSALVHSADLTGSKGAAAQIDGGTDPQDRASLPAPIPVFSPTVPQPAEFVYRPDKPPTEFTFKPHDPVKRKASEAPERSASTEKPPDAGPSTTNEPTRKKRKARQPKAHSKSPTDTSMSAPSTSAPSSSAYPYGGPPSYGGYIPYMPYPLPYGRGYPYPAVPPPGSAPYPYPYPGYPGYPYPPSYPYPVPSQHPYPYALAHTYAPPLPASFPPLPPPKGAGSSKDADSNADDSRSTDTPETASAGSASKGSEQFSSDQTSATKPNAPPRKFNFVSPMVSNPVPPQSEVNGSRRNRDVFTNYTPQSVQNGQNKKRRTAARFEPSDNAQEHLNKIRASLELSKKDSSVTKTGEAPSSSSTTGKGKGSFRYMFYKPVTEGTNNTEEVSSSTDGQSEKEAPESQPEHFLIPHEPSLHTQQTRAVEGQNEGAKADNISQSSRWCRNKACNRVIPSTTPGWLCEKCKAKIKHHQTKTKHRLKLEPLKKVSPTKVVVTTSKTGGQPEEESAHTTPAESES